MVEVSFINDLVVLHLVVLEHLVMLLFTKINKKTIKLPFFIGRVQELEHSVIPRLVLLLKALEMLERNGRREDLDYLSSS